MDIETRLPTDITPKPLQDPWDQLPDEPDDAYSVFRKYLHLGFKRSLLEAARISFVEAGILVPGQPLRQAPASVERWSSRYAWRARAHAWDQKRWEEEQALYDELSRSAVIEMVNRQIEGWQIIAEAAIKNFFERDPDGNLIFDLDGKPKVRIIEDESVALRAFKQAVAGERTARGLPPELVIMSTDDIKKRLVDLNRQVATLQNDDDVVEGEYTELDDDAEE
jgi:hypothetical protein